MLRPFQEFAAKESAGGILLLACTLVALVWANSPWAGAYSALWHTPVGISIGDWRLSKDLHFWVNDFLMAVFFFVVGLEIKRELLVGELATVRQAALPIAAAAGGVLLPALIYTALNARGPGISGWGVPMATDIAFALGVMALLGRRVPAGLKVFLTALAIADDIAAVLVIALFYTASISLSSVIAAAIFLSALFGMNLLGVRRPLAYALGGAALWFAVLSSGIHATVAGVALAFTIPSSTPLEPKQFLERSRRMLHYFARASEPGASMMASDEQQAAIHALEAACEKVQPALHRMEHALHPWVTFMIMPVFALANAGVALSGGLGRTILEPVTLGVILGLLLGKPLGITLAAWLAVRAGSASLPAGVGWRHIHGAGWLGGIGFTMSLFIANLAFTDESLLAMAKVGILTASLCASIAGSLILLRARRAAV